MKSKNVFITGIAGFTGKYIAQEYISLGYEVFGCGSYVDDANPNHFTANLNDVNRIKSLLTQIAPDIIIHLAAISFVEHHDKQSIYNTNVIGTFNLLTAIFESKINASSVVIASSANVYGAVTQWPVGEDQHYAPVNDYAVSKVSMEYMASLWFDRLPITITRPFNYTGVGQNENFLVPKIVAHYRSGMKSIELGNIDVYRDISDVRNVARIYTQLAVSSNAGKTINICSGDSYSVSDILDSLSILAGYEIQVISSPDFIRGNEIPKIVGSTTYLKSLIASDLRYNFDETIEWMYRY